MGTVVFAQTNNMQVHSGGQIIFSRNVLEMDSITFSATVNATPETEMAKYETSVEVGVIEASVGSDYTTRVIRLKEGFYADNSVTLTIVSAGTYFDKSTDGKTLTVKAVPGSSGANDEVQVKFSKGGVEKTLKIAVGIFKASNINANETFVLYGYDVVNSGYINRSDVKFAAPIIDLNQANSVGLIVQSTATQSTYESATSNSVSEVYKSMTVGTSVGVEVGLFSAKASTEFSVSNGSKKTNFFAKGRGVHQSKEEWLRNADPAFLKHYFTETFKYDIANLSAKQLIAKYGTHLIKRIYWGGTAEFNFSYSGTEITTEQNMKVSVEASYAVVSASASTEQQKKASHLNENSKFYAKTVGGNNAAFTNMESFAAGYEAWVASVASQPDICAFGEDKFNDSFIGLWELVKQVDEAKAQAVQAEFEVQLIARGNMLAGMVYRHLVETEPYIYDIKTYTDMVNIPVSYTYLGEISGVELKSAMLKKVEANNHEAIAEIRMRKEGDGTTLPSGWKEITIPAKIILGIPLFPNHYLMYRMVNENDTEALDDIVVLGDSLTDPALPEGYSWATFSDGTKGMITNTDKGSCFAYKKKAFTWVVVP
ncbi:MAG: hypothetical protein BGO29_14285 [Bacteroidales bacterium 36-12]|nr:MAG: hypothetical protein BGO29_14285 [Bacteroidales bacterium 36-12]